MATKSYSRTRTLVECALMIAVGTVLAQIKIFEMPFGGSVTLVSLSLIHISEPTRLGMISYAVFCLKKKKRTNI